MDTTPVCPTCGKPLPTNAPQGLCPECVLKAGFATGTQPGPGEPGRPPRRRFIPPAPAELASLFPQIEIQELVGQGGMGAVYRARQPALDRLVALKILPSHAADDPGFAERFTREARALARLSHPNIVGVHEYGQAGNFHYFIMEFVDGMNLRQLERAARLTPAQALQIIPQVCEALQFAHNEGVVHRDIKPENILMDKRGRVKIADFGIAKMVGQEGDMSLTGAQDIMGTPHYMAPEQIERPRDVDHRADIYSLGVVFYEMLTGELPLGKFQSPSEKVQVDVRLDEVVLRALKKEPERRYQQASEVKTAVDTIARGPGRLPPRLAPSPPPLAKGPATSDKTILPVFLLAFLLGPFGVHRFYVGKIGTGLLQLGTLGVCGIWTMIDWILIVCAAFTDGQGRLITEWIKPQPGATPQQNPPAAWVKPLVIVMAVLAIVLVSAVTFLGVAKQAARGQFGQMSKKFRIEVLPNPPAQGRVHGSGTIVTDTRTVRPFSRIEMHDEGDLDVEVLPRLGNLPMPIMQAWPTNCVTITADDNVVPLIILRNEGETLTIHSPKGYRTRPGVKIHVVVPYLDSLAAYSSGNLRVTGLEEPTFKVAALVSSDVVLKGKVGRLDVTVSGSGDVRAEEVLTKDARVTINGSGDAVVQVTNTLTATVNGSGNITYLGHPAKVQKSVHGSGSIEARREE